MGRIPEGNTEACVPEYVEGRRSAKEISEHWTLHRAATDTPLFRECLRRRKGRARQSSSWELCALGARARVSTRGWSAVALPRLQVKQSAPQALSVSRLLNRSSRPCRRELW
jgi:hypothetical protein